jgi:hypothetical protein
MVITKLTAIVANMYGKVIFAQMFYAPLLSTHVTITPTTSAQQQQHPM